jgi:hypothetical protein
MAASRSRPCPPLATETLGETEDLEWDTLARRLAESLVLPRISSTERSEIAGDLAPPPRLAARLPRVWQDPHFL